MTRGTTQSTRDFLLGITFIALIVMGLSAMITPVHASPINGIYTSTDIGGQLFTGRASTWRSGINSGFPHVFHIQSWDGVSLGTQYDISCGQSTSMSVVDNRVAGVGTIVYTSTYTGGTFTFLSGAWPWGDGTGTLGTTSLVTTVQYVMIAGNSTPVAAVVNGNSSGAFLGGCALTFAIANGDGVGETTSLNPAIAKPSAYPSFLDGSCALASPTAQFGTWGNVRTITFMIDCATPTRPSTWGQVKSIYR